MTDGSIDPAWTQKRHSLPGDVEMDFRDSLWSQLSAGIATNLLRQIPYSSSIVTKPSLVMDARLTGMIRADRLITA